MKTDMTLTRAEEKLIFGTLLEDLKVALELNEVDSLAVQQAKTGEKLKNVTKALGAQDKQNGNDIKSGTFGSDNIAATSALKQSQKLVQKAASSLNKPQTDPVSGIPVTESAPVAEVVPSELEKMLFGGNSGNTLKYLLTGEINNNNMDSLALVKSLEAEKDIQVIIKKLKYYMKKGKRLSHDDYIDAKVLKNRFRGILETARNKDKKRFS